MAAGAMAAVEGGGSQAGRRHPRGTASDLAGVGRRGLKAEITGSCVIVRRIALRTCVVMGAVIFSGVRPQGCARRGARSLMRAPASHGLSVA